MVLRAATKDENVPRPRTLIMVGARDRGRATLAHFWPAHEYGPDAADAQRMVAWLDKLTNLSSSIRAEVSSSESSKKETAHLGFVGMGSGTRTQRSSWIMGLTGQSLPIFRASRACALR
jgi:hypothetical protein